MFPPVTLGLPPIIDYIGWPAILASTLKKKKNVHVLVVCMATDRSGALSNGARARAHTHTHTHTHTQRGTRTHDHTDYTKRNLHTTLQCEPVWPSGKALGW